MSNHDLVQVRRDGISHLRERLVGIEPVIDGSDRSAYEHQQWAEAMSMLNAWVGRKAENAMIGKADDPAPMPEPACKGCHFDGDCHMQDAAGGKVGDCTLRVPATSALRVGVDPAHLEHLVYVSNSPPVTQKGMEAAINAAVAEAMKAHMNHMHGLEADRHDILAMRGVAEAKVREMLKAHEEKLHEDDMLARPPCNECAHALVCKIDPDSGIEDCEHFLPGDSRVSGTHSPAVGR
ncbi:MAG: hypothetical protein WC648_05420 [Candidatus Paceibacterota bacterium]|jgi:hypothetical protein